MDSLCAAAEERRKPEPPEPATLNRFAAVQVFHYYSQCCFASAFNAILLLLKRVLMATLSHFCLSSADLSSILVYRSDKLIN
jgi:hypothetical protein